MEIVNEKENWLFEEIKNKTDKSLVDHEKKSKDMND